MGMEMALTRIGLNSWTRTPLIGGSPVRSGFGPVQSGSSPLCGAGFESGSSPVSVRSSDRKKPSCSPVALTGCRVELPAFGQFEKHLRTGEGDIEPICLPVPGIGTQTRAIAGDAAPTCTYPPRNPPLGPDGSDRNAATTDRPPFPKTSGRHP